MTKIFLILHSSLAVVEREREREREEKVFLLIQGLVSYLPLHPAGKKDY